MKTNIQTIMQVDKNTFNTKCNSILENVKKLPFELVNKIYKYLHNINLEELHDEFFEKYYIRENMLDNIHNMSLKDSIQIHNIFDDMIECKMYALAYRKYGNCSDFLLVEKFEGNNNIYYLMVDITADLGSKVIYVRRRYFELVNKNGQNNNYKIINNEVVERDVFIQNDEVMLSDCETEMLDVICLFLDTNDNNYWLIKKYYDRDFSQETVADIIDYYFY